MTRAVLVVGGAGYVGAHTCKALSQAGYRPIVFDNLSTGHRNFVRWGPLVQADIADSGAVSDAISRHDCVAVLHFAACAYVGESVVDPAKYYGNNVAGTLAVLNGMRAAGCGALVFSSTCAVYGQPDCVPISELTRPDPINPYGASKLMVERIISDFRSAYGLRAIALRYFNACGADPDGELGELRNPETHLIPRAMMALQGHIEDFEIFGADFDTPDGTAIRDYIHVADLADAHVAALSSLLNGAAGGVFNLGTGHGYSVMEVLRAIEREAGESLPSPKGPRRMGDPAVLVATASRAQAELRFRPKLSDIETIVRTAWGWHRRVHPRRNVTPSL
jgi:UDP-glucose 4-epimerase/UDP-arabinose 4-epimerase